MKTSIKKHLERMKLKKPKAKASSQITEYLSTRKIHKQVSKKKYVTK